MKEKGNKAFRETDVINTYIINMYYMLIHLFQYQMN